MGFRQPMRIFILAAFLFASGVLGSSSEVRAAPSGCEGIHWAERDGLLYIDPTSTTRVRINPQSMEVALRLIGAFDTSESLYPKLERNGEAVHIIGTREVGSSTRRDVLELFAIRRDSRLLWSMVFNGERGDAPEQLIISNLQGTKLSCEEFSSDSHRRLTFRDLGLSDQGSTRFYSVSIPADALVYRKLGL